jgi:hypothetical protein
MSSSFGSCIGEEALVGLDKDFLLLIEVSAAAESRLPAVEVEPEGGGGTDVKKEGEEREREEGDGRLTARLQPNPKADLSRPMAKVK